MKKLLTILLLICITAALIVPAYAENHTVVPTIPKKGKFEVPVQLLPTAICQHEEIMYQRELPNRNNYFVLDEQQHEYREYFEGICQNLNCKKVFVMYRVTIREFHKFVSAGDNHQVGKSLHDYFYSCRHCNYKYTYTEACSGNGQGCAVHLSIDPPTFPN